MIHKFNCDYCGKYVEDENKTLSEYLEEIFDECNITEDFKEGCDIAFMDAPNGQFLALKKGYFMVFFPQDAHAPCRKSENSDFAHKLVFKIKL